MITEAVATEMLPSSEKRQQVWRNLIPHLKAIMGQKYGGGGVVVKEISHVGGCCLGSGLFMPCVSLKLFMIPKEQKNHKI